MTETTSPSALSSKMERVETQTDTTHVHGGALPELERSELSRPHMRKEGPLSRVRRLIYDRFLQPLVLSKNPPWFDARGVSLGFVAGFIVPIGGQFILIAVLRMLFRFNTILALSFSFISNPFTVIPLYRGYYGIGSLFIGKTGRFDIEEFDSMIGGAVGQTYAWDSLAAFGDLGKDILLRWFIGAVVLAVIFGVAGYILTFLFQKKRCVSGDGACEDITDGAAE